MPGHFFQHFVALFGVHDLHHFDLVKLVLADHAARVAAVAAGFGAEARGVGGQLDGQFGFLHDCIAHEVGQRHFRGGNEVQRLVVWHGLTVLAAFFGGEQIAFKLGQLAGGTQ